MHKVKVGVLRETKNPPDRRVVVSPKKAKEIMEKFPQVELFVQKAENRCFSNKEYSDLGINLVDNIDDCDILLGVKEVKIDHLIPNKKYLFFSHTAKEQVYNRPLLKALLDKKIQIIDYEYLTNKQGMRLVAFGRWAGIVGTYNGLLAYGQKHGLYDLKQAHECYDFEELKQELKKVKLDNIKIIITGGGRVAGGTVDVLTKVIGVKQVNKEAFLNQTFDTPVFCQIEPQDYVKRKDGKPFDFSYFISHPAEHTSTFKPFTKVADMYITSHFWDEKSPVFMTKEDMKESDFNIKLIADISCDIAGPVPSTIRPSTIAEPLYGYNPQNEEETGAFDTDSITVMAVDNLPGELPRNASEAFGRKLIDNVFPSLFGEDTEGIVERASITNLDGKLTEKFKYLEHFINQ